MRSDCWGADLSDYQFGSRTQHHLFCSHCGVHSFGRGHVDVLGGDYYSINVVCLDDVAPFEIANAPVRYFDGRHNNWQSPPAEVRHLSLHRRSRVPRHGLQFGKRKQLLGPDFLDERLIDVGFDEDVERILESPIFVVTIPGAFFRQMPERDGVRE
jgi:hypothetical protein